MLTLVKFTPDFQKVLKGIGKFQSEDEKLRDIIQKLPTDESLQKRFIQKNDLLYTRGANDEFYLLCVPKILTERFAKEYHCSLGHFGAYKTWCALRNEVWWTNMHKVVKRVVRTCELCQKTKCAVLPDPPLKSIIPSGQNELIAVDFYGPLPVSRGGVAYIFVVLDVFSKYVTFYALKRITTRAALNRLISDYIPKHGSFAKILSDRGTQFTSDKWKCSLEALNVQVIFSSIRHPRANPAERIMRELGRLCRAFCNDQHTRWAIELPKFAQFMNSVVHESTGFSPNELQLGTERDRFLPRALQGAPTGHPPVPYEQKLVLARESLLGKAERRNTQYSSRKSPGFNLGDLVLLKAHNVSSAIKAETKKFLLLFEGPFRIKKAIRDNTFVLEDVETGRERGVFYATHLRHYFPSESHPSPEKASE